MNLIELFKAYHDELIVHETPFRYRGMEGLLKVEFLGDHCFADPNLSIIEQMHVQLPSTIVHVDSSGTKRFLAFCPILLLLNDWELVTTIPANLSLPECT